MTADLAAEVLTCLATGDVGSTRSYCANAVRAGLSLGRLVDVGIAPAMEQVGLLWESGEWSVADVHGATAAAEAGLDAAAAVTSRPAPKNGTVLVSSVEGEWHSLPGRLVAAVLSSAGWNVRLLGASQSSGELRDVVARTRPRAVLLSCSLSTSLPALAGSAMRIRNLEVPVYVGGRALGPDERRAISIGADGWAADTAGAVELVGRRARRIWVGEEVHRYRQFLRRRATYPTWLGVAQETLARSDMPSLEEADLRHLLDAACVSLLVEDPRVLDEDVRWLRRVLRARGTDASIVSRSLVALAEAEESAATGSDVPPAASPLLGASGLMNMHQAEQAIHLIPRWS
jgi:methanogenic corrinoid protein MtbC1